MYSQLYAKLRLKSLQTTLLIRSIFPKMDSLNSTKVLVWPSLVGIIPSSTTPVLLPSRLCLELVLCVLSLTSLANLSRHQFISATQLGVITTLCLLLLALKLEPTDTSTPRPKVWILLAWLLILKMRLLVQQCCCTHAPTIQLALTQLKSNGKRLRRFARETNSTHSLTLLTKDLLQDQWIKMLLVWGTSLNKDLRWSLPSLLQRLWASTVNVLEHFTLSALTRHLLKELCLRRRSSWELLILHHPHMVLELLPPSFATLPTANNGWKSLLLFASAWTIWELH